MSTIYWSTTTALLAIYALFRSLYARICAINVLRTRSECYQIPHELNSRGIMSIYRRRKGYRCSPTRPSFPIPQPRPMHYRLIPKAALCEIQPCPCAHYDGYHQELLLGCHEISSTHQCWECTTHTTGRPSRWHGLLRTRLVMWRLILKASRKRQARARCQPCNIPIMPYHAGEYSRRRRRSQTLFLSYKVNH